MPTSSPTEPIEPTESTDGETAPVESPATTVLTKDPLASDDAAAAPKVWTPRPHDLLSPEDKDPEDLTDKELEDITSGGLSKGILGGAAAISAAALGLVSISGTWFSTIILTQTQFNASLNATGKTTATQLAEGYTGPWHTMAWHNGIFAAVAVLVGAAVLFAAQFLSVRITPNWIKAVAIAAIVLGFVGLLVSAGMYFDWFTTAIHVPPQAPASTTPTG
ncbi:hypothetical protein [Streptacidiphilus sp. PAMC 29251]